MSQTFGYFLRKARWLSGASAKEWASYLGVKPHTIWRWERDEGRPHLRVLPKVYALAIVALDEDDQKQLKRLFEQMVHDHAAGKALR